MAQQIKKKFIANDAVDGTKLRLESGQAIRGLDQEGVEHDLLKLQNDKIYLKGQEAVTKPTLDAAIASLESADLAHLQSAKDYTDQKLQDLIGGAPAALDTLKEISDALANSGDAVAALTQVVASNLVQAQNYADGVVSTETARAIAAESALSDRLDIVEGDVSALQSDVAGHETRLQALEAAPNLPLFQKERIVVGSTLTHVDLQHSALVNSLVVAVGRLMIHPNEDYTTSTVDGKTRLTFIGDFAQGGIEGVESDDTIFVTYVKL